VQALADQLAEVLRRSEIQYPGLTTREVQEALALAARQARPQTMRGRPAAAALAGLGAMVVAGLAVWRNTGGSLSVVEIAALGAVVLAVISIVRRFSE